MLPIASIDNGDAVVLRYEKRKLLGSIFYSFFTQVDSSKLSIFPSCLKSAPARGVTLSVTGFIYDYDTSVMLFELDLRVRVLQVGTSALKPCHGNVLKGLKINS